jgi:hypothetical protein
MKIQILKLLFTLCFIAGLSLTSNGQTRDKVWSFGPELGVNFSKFGKDADETDYQTGLIAGGFLTYSILNTHAFTAKILYSQKGARDEASNTNVQLNYIEVPIIWRVFFNREGDVRPNVFAGPSFGFLNGVKVKVADGDFETLDNYEDSFNSFDVGLGLGLGLNIRVGNEVYFIVDTRYTFGFSDLSKSATDVNNQAIAITAGLSFGIGN